MSNEAEHEVPYTRPLATTRELIDICRLVWRRETVVYDGQRYTLPLPADQGTGLGKGSEAAQSPCAAQLSRSRSDGK
ncbi:MAG TPA: hypothetical protein VMM60_12770 [Ilumatobacter sp.]|nr:hypothetical protein [Ilumatobacter sp.]